MGGLESGNISPRGGIPAGGEWNNRYFAGRASASFSIVMSITLLAECDLCSRLFSYPLARWRSLLHQTASFGSTARWLLRWRNCS